MDSPLLVKSKQFALDIIKACNKIKCEKRESGKLYSKKGLFKE